MERYVCIHGHFWQPPRENPWLEAVERQETAHPYHDWSERVAAECYGPNSAARVLNRDGRIIEIRNNYARISFNVGPTLLAWLAAAQPEIYAAILEADRRSRERNGGHGSALAQAYNHVILPLASSRNKRTLIRWGVRDFEHRFRRPPEGMWLAETAVDLETLDLMAEHGIRFTILSTGQASQVRPPGQERFEAVGQGGIDPRRAYRCQLPSGRQMAIFFCDVGLRSELTAGGLLHNGEALAARLLQGFDGGEQPQLVHLATNGEVFGHHHHRGEMALAYCLHHLEARELARVTVYGRFLELCPPAWEVRVADGSSWSCEHGVQRWCADCGCGGDEVSPRPWRAPLRRALDWLGDQLEQLYEGRAAELLTDPWGARDDYIYVMLDRRPETLQAFFQAWAHHPLGEQEQVQALRLLEMERNALLMFTSSGWDAEDIASSETIQILRFACRASQLARQLGAQLLEQELVRRLALAPGSTADYPDGERVYQRLVQPARTGLRRVGAHFAMASLFRDQPSDGELYAFSVRTLLAERLEAGKLRLALGRIEVQSRLTLDRADLVFAVLHAGDQNVTGGVRAFSGQAALDQLMDGVKRAFGAGDLAETILAMDRFFEHRRYGLRHLFRDEQGRILQRLFRAVEQRLESFHREVYSEHYHLVLSMLQLAPRAPAVFRASAAFVVNRELRHCLGRRPVDGARVEHLLGEIDAWGVQVDRELLGLQGGLQIDELVRQLVETPLDDALLDEIEQLLGVYSRLDAPLNLWRSQNALYEIGTQQFFLRSRMAQQGDARSGRWVERFKRVANLFEVRFE